MVFTPPVPPGVARCSSCSTTRCIGATPSWHQTYKNTLHSITAVQERIKTINTKQKTKDMPQWSNPETNDNISKQKEKFEYEAQDQKKERKTCTKQQSKVLLQTTNSLA